MFKQFGHHYIIEVLGVDPEKLNNLEFLKTMMYKQQELQKSNQLTFSYHLFEPVGITQILMLSESHISIHTFPEDGYQQLDLFTCQDDDPIEQVNYIIDQLKPVKYTVEYVQRGISIEDT